MTLFLVTQYRINELIMTWQSKTLNVTRVNHTMVSHLGTSVASVSQLAAPSPGDLKLEGTNILLKTKSKMFAMWTRRPRPVWFTLPVDYYSVTLLLILCSTAFRSRTLLLDLILYFTLNYPHFASVCITDDCL